LESEFNLVGIYKSENPELYDEKRANEILNKLDTKAYRSIMQNLRKRQLESLQNRPDPELIRLRNENQQLRDHAKHLQDRNQQLAARTPETGLLARPTPQDETQRLREQIRQLQEQVTTQAELQSKISECDKNLRLLQETAAQIFPLASRTITGLNEFERLILAAGHEYKNKRPDGTEEFIDAALSQVTAMQEIRENLEKLFAPAS
jgi:gas vesicle protein